MNWFNFPRALHVRCSVLVPIFTDEGTELGDTAPSHSASTCKAVLLDPKLIL